MTKSTIKKLRRVREMREARLNGTELLVNPKGRPEPTLPGHERLTAYLRELANSNRNLLPEAGWLIRYILKGAGGKESGAGGKERRG